MNTSVDLGRLFLGGGLFLVGALGLGGLHLHDKWVRRNDPKLRGDR